MKLFAILFQLLLATHADLYANGTAKGKIAELFTQEYWSGEIKPEDLTVINGDGRRMEVIFKKTVVISKGSEKVVICKGSKVRFTGSEIYHIDAKSPGCKVGDLEAVEGTTIGFWESEDNLLRSIVTAKPVKMRSHTWPAKSQLLFYFYDKGGLMLYAAVLGSDLKGTKYKAGQKVYIGSIRDSDAEQTDTLSLYGEDPTL